MFNFGRSNIERLFLERKAVGAEGAIEKAITPLRAALNEQAEAAPAMHQRTITPNSSINDHGDTPHPVGSFIHPVKPGPSGSIGIEHRIEGHVTINHHVTPMPGAEHLANTGVYTHRELGYRVVNPVTSRESIVPHRMAVPASVGRPTQPKGLIQKLGNAVKPLIQKSEDTDAPGAPQA